MRAWANACLLLLLASSAAGQVPGTCAPGVAERMLDDSDVVAGLYNTGTLFYRDGVPSQYVVPAASGLSPLFAAAPWVGGYIGGELRVSSSYFSTGEMWPGPLLPGGALPSPTDCSSYDRIWVVTTGDVALYEATGVATPDLAAWPVHLGAEVVDGDGISGNYDLPAGDRPRVYGSQTAFWVMNDVGNVHLQSETPPIGLEMRMHAFAIQSSETALAQATFFRVTLVNRNSQPLTDALFGIWADPDVGFVSDDYVGVDTTRGLGIAYNGDDHDGDYGTAPPALGFDLLSDRPAAFRLITEDFPVSDPTNGIEAYRALSGVFGDGTPIREGLWGYQSGGAITTFHFPGDPVTPAFWSEPCLVLPCQASLPSDRRLLLSSESFEFAPEASRTFDLGILFARGASYLASVTELRTVSDMVQGLYDSGALFEVGVTTEPAPTAPTARLAVSPNPASRAAVVAVTLQEPAYVELAAHDVMGRKISVIRVGHLPSGTTEVPVDLTRWSPGVYWVRTATASWFVGTTLVVGR